MTCKQSFSEWLDKADNRFEAAYWSLFVYKGKRILALVAARAGSKRLPNKNIRPFQGLPLLCWTLRAAGASEVLDRTMLSTDSSEMARISAEEGFPVPFMRPAELATDDADVMDVIAHTMQQIAERFDYLVLLQPTSPLRSPIDIDQCVRNCVDDGFDAVVSVTSLPKPPSFYGMVNRSGTFRKFSARTLPRSSVGLLNGAVYVASVEMLLQHRSFYAGRVGAYVMPPERSWDIDTQEELLLAEYSASLAKVKPEGSV